MSSWIDDRLLKELNKIKEKKKEKPTTSSMDELVKNSLANRNNRPSFLYQLYITKIEAIQKRLSKKQKIPKTLKGIEIEEVREGQINWIQYLEEEEG